MTKYAFTRNITCTDSDVCGASIQLKLETLLGGKIHIDSEIEQAKGHLSIYHEHGNHKIWVFLYDTDNEHESDVEGVTKITPSNKVSKWDLPKPSIQALKAVL